MEEKMVYVRNIMQTCFDCLNMEHSADVDTWAADIISLCCDYIRARRFVVSLDEFRAALDDKGLHISNFLLY